MDGHRCTMLTVLLVVCCVCAVSAVEYTTHACQYSNLTMSCPGDKTIMIRSALYGQWGEDCTAGCCAPDMSKDCVAYMDQDFPDDLAVLREKCDNQTSCHMVVFSVTLGECPGIQQSSYTQVNYSCLPEDVTTEPPTTPIPPTTEPPTTPAPTRPIPTQPTPAPGGLGGGVIAGIVLGVLLLLVCVILAAVIIYKYLHRPPPAKRGAQRKPRPPGQQRVKAQYDNTAFTSDDHVQIQIVDDKSPGTNGSIPLRTPPSAPPPHSDGKRKSKPISTAESIKYAKDKEELIRAGFRQQAEAGRNNSVDAGNSTAQKKSRKKKRNKSGDKGLNSADSSDKPLNSRADNSDKALNSRADNDYENVVGITDYTYMNVDGDS